MKLNRLKHILTLWGYYATTVKADDKFICRTCKRYIMKTRKISYSDIKDDLNPYFMLFDQSLGDDKLKAWFNAVDHHVTIENLVLLPKKELDWIKKQGFDSMQGMDYVRSAL